jgi:nucleoside-diphosphate-sugar epimerase
MSGRRVLITGAGGFVGRALVAGFAELGWGVIGVDRAFNEVSADPRVRCVVADVATGVPEEVPAVELVVHAAWVTTDPDSLGITRSAYVALNIRPLLAVLEHAARSRPAAFVFLSSSGVFAAEDGNAGLTDTDRPTGSHPYAAAKRAAELLVPAALDSETAAHIVRLGYLFGPDEQVRPSRERLSPIAGWLGAARAGEPLDVRSDDPVREWTFAPDLAAALERVVEATPSDHPIHLGSPRTHRDSEIAALIAGMVSGADVRCVPAEGRVKPPMIPSEIPALHDFAWTEVPTGLSAIVAEEVPA